MSLEDDLSKLERQVNSFSIAGAAGNFHTGFSVGDDARGSGAGVQRARVGPTPEDRISFLEQSFKNFTIRGGHEVSVTGSLVAGGFAISAKAAPSGEGTGGGGPTPTGACCIGSSCSILTSGDCATMGGTYQGDGTVCDPNPCAPPPGACCADDNTCSITTASGCVGTYQGDGTTCDPNPCCPTCTAHVHIEFSIDFDGPCNVSTIEDHDVAVTWINCDFTVSSEKFDLIIPLTSAIDDPVGCFGMDLASAHYEIFAFYDTVTGWSFTFKIHLGTGSFNTSPDDPGPGLVNLNELGTLCQTAYGGTSCVFFTCP